MRPTLIGLRLVQLLLLCVFLGSLAAMGTVAVSGGVNWSLGSHRVLSVGHLGRPFALALLSATGLLSTFSGRIRRSLHPRQALKSWLFAAVLIWAGYHGLSGERHLIRGDGKEYIIQTQAIALLGQLRIDCPAIKDYWNRTNPYGDALEDVIKPRREGAPYALRRASGGFGGLYIDRFGDYRFYHPWAYALAVAPLYALLHALFGPGPVEYLAFRGMNVLFLCLPFLLAWRRSPSWPLLATCGVAFYSPLIPYCGWQHPELFCFCLVFLAFGSAAAGVFRYAAPIFLGIAACQNQPIALFFPLLLFHMWPRTAVPRRAWLGMGLALIAGTGVTLSSALYFRHCFGVGNLISAAGFADLRFASVARAAHVFFSPLTGALWMYPACFLLLPSVVSRRSIVFVLGAVVSVFAAAYLASATRNFNSAQVGALRYTVWILVPLWIAVLNGAWLPRLQFRIRTFVWLIGLALTIMLIRYLHLNRLIDTDAAEFESCRRAVPETAALFRMVRYHDDAETLAETIMGEELPTPAQFDGLYVWNLGRSRSLWLVSAAAQRNLKRLKWSWVIAQPHESRPGSGDRSAPAEAFSATRLPMPDNVAISRHPVLGEYRLFWVACEVAAVDADVPVHLHPYRTGSKAR